MTSPFAIGENMCEIHKDAYMNGYVASYELTEENEKKRSVLWRLSFLIENEEELYQIVREKGNKIEWD